MIQCETCKHGPIGACGVKERMLEYHRIRQLGPANDQSTACQAAVFALEAADAVELVR
jgi:hypothetical protein